MRELVRAPGHDRRLSLGWLGTAFVEHFCVHGPGDVEGDPIELDDEIAGFFVDAYTHDPDGRRLYSTALLSRAKGRAKSELAGFFVLFEAFGPCRFAGWARGGEVFRWRDFTYVYAPGEPIGHPITYPFIRCLATEESQAGNTYDNVLFNLTEGPLGEGLPPNAAGLTRAYLPGGGEIVPSTAASASKDGGKESFTVADEPHLYISDELRRMYRTVDRNLRKRKAASPWMLQTSTMYQDGEDSVAERTHRRAKAIAAGRSRAARLLYDHRQAPPVLDAALTDKAVMRAALAEVYGPAASWMDIDSIIEDEFWNLEKDLNESRRYFFNEPGGHADAWMTAPRWDACADPARVVAHGDTIVLFFDGSTSDDATTLVGCRVSDGHLVVLGLWEKPPGPAGKGWRVNRRDVDRVVHEVFDTYDVAAFFADVRDFESYVDAWADEFGDRLLIEATTGRNHHAVAFDMRKRVAEFTEATGRTLVDIRDRELTHDGHARLRAHVLNARRRPNKWGVSIGKSSRESPDKIDLAVSAIGARHARRQLLASDAWHKRQQQRSGDVWAF